MHELVQEGISSGTVVPLKHRVFGREDVQAAFRHMAEGIHIGKIVIQVNITVIAVRNC